MQHSIKLMAVSLIVPASAGRQLQATLVPCSVLRKVGNRVVLGCRRRSATTQLRCHAKFWLGVLLSLA